MVPAFPSLLFLLIYVLIKRVFYSPIFKPLGQDSVYKATGARAKVRDFESRRISNFRPRLRMRFIRLTFEIPVTRQQMADIAQTPKPYT